MCEQSALAYESHLSVWSNVQKLLAANIEGLSISDCLLAVLQSVGVGVFDIYAWDCTIVEKSCGARCGRCSGNSTTVQMPSASAGFTCAHSRCVSTSYDCPGALCIWHAVLNLSNRAVAICVQFAAAHLWEHLSDHVLRHIMADEDIFALAPVCWHTNRVKCRQLQQRRRGGSIM